MEELKMEADDRKKILWAQQVASGMTHLKYHGIVHLDLAARNILLTHPGEVAKISDFGLAKFQTLDDIIKEEEDKMRRNRRNMYRLHSCTSAETTTTILDDETRKLYLPLYMLPLDVWLSVDSASSATDVWSYGILLWELFTAGNSPFDYMKWVMRQGPRFPSFQG